MTFGLGKAISHEPGQLVGQQNCYSFRHLRTIGFHSHFGRCPNIALQKGHARAQVTCNHVRVPLSGCKLSVACQSLHDRR